MTIKEQLNEIKEDDLRKKVIIPMMYALKCEHVFDNHGSLEDGIDVLYGSNNVFGQKFFGGIVLKNDGKINKGNKLYEIDRQVKEALVRRDHPLDLDSDIRVREIVVITSYDVSSYARKYLKEQIYMNTFLNFRIICGSELEQVIKNVIDKFRKNKDGEEYKFNVNNFKQMCEEYTGRKIPDLKDNDVTNYVEGNEIK